MTGFGSLMETVKTQTCIVKNAPVLEDTAF
jgi:hypothetical protein